jgi:LysM repeat protein
MSKKWYILLAGMVMVSLLLTSCKQSASSSKTPNASATPKALNTQQAAGATDDPIAMLYAYATQTALAGGGGTPIPPVATVQTPGAPGGVTPMPSPTQYVIMPTLTVGPRPTSYTLQEGEYPYCIARRFNINPVELLGLNNLSDASGSLYKPGLVLQIPQSGNPFPGNRALTPHPATYTVQADDTIYGVACHYGDVDPMAIAQMNGLQPPYTLTTGTALQIP